MSAIQKNERYSGFSRSFLIAALIFMLPACTMEVPTYYTQEKIQVVEETAHVEMPTAELTEAALKEIAARYTRYGDGEIDVMVTYDPSSRKHSAMWASDEAARIARVLKGEQVGNVQTGILPVRSGETSRTHISYTSYRAEKPEGCENFEDITDIDHDDYKSYRLGCSTAEYTALQVSKPKDLLGRDVDVETDGRRATSNVSAYRWGPSLSGDVQAEQSSE